MREDDAIMSVLPYWHSFALTAEIFTMLYVGGKIFIPKSKSTFLKDISLFKPTVILSIPRLAELLKKGIEENVSKKSDSQKKIFRLVQDISLKYHASDKRSLSLKAAYFLARKIVLNKIKKTFGGKLRYFIGGGAPLDASLQRFFLSIDLPIYQGYGLTEASPIISINAPHEFKIGTSGKIIPWMMKKYGGDYCFEDANGNRAKNIEGELLVKGKCVMKGYWNLPDETEKALQDGWLYTGDVGFIDEFGFLELSGRKKSLICLEGGEKFYPEFIEERIKSSPYITQAMIVGEGQRRCSALINVDEEIARDLPEDEINKIVANELRELTKDLETYQKPLSFIVLPNFSPEDELLTNTQKIRRHKVFEKYKDRIDSCLTLS
jgi:long-chain acyl-CoA synthetase